MSQGFISLSYRVNRTILQSDSGQSSLACSLYFINTIYFLFKIGKKCRCECISKGLFILQTSGTWALEILPSHNILGDGYLFWVWFSNLLWQVAFSNVFKFWVSSAQCETDPVKSGTKLGVECESVERKKCWTCTCTCAAVNENKIFTLPVSKFKNIVAIDFFLTFFRWVLLS